MALKVVDQLLLARMLIALNVLTNDFESDPNGDSLPLKMKVRVTARRFKPEVLALKHGISNQLGVIIRSNDEPELQWIELWGLSNRMRPELGLPVNILMLNGRIKVHHPLPIIHLFCCLHLAHLLLLLILPIVHEQIGLLVVSSEVLQLDLWRVVHDLLGLSLEVGIVLIEELADLGDLGGRQVPAQ